MEAREKRLLQTCGIGWFILKMAEDHDLFTVTYDLDKLYDESTNKTKLYAYNALHGSRKRLIREIVQTGLDDRVRVEGIDQPARYYYNVARDLYESFYH